jgi:hypothetical protein
MRYLLPLALLVLSCGGEPATEPESGPDLSTPQAALAELKRSFNEGDWRAHFRLHTKDSVESLVLPMLLAGAMSPEMKDLVQPLVDRHVRAPEPGTDPESARRTVMSRLKDPEAFYVEAVPVLREASGLEMEILDFEDLEVKGDVASAKQVLRMSGERIRRVSGQEAITSREPIGLRKMDGRWLVSYVK